MVVRGSKKSPRKFWQIKVFGKRVGELFLSKLKKIELSKDVIHAILELHG